MKQKGLRKLASMILAVVMVISMSITGFAESSGYEITISNSVTDSIYSFYKIFDATYTTDSEGNTTGTTYYITSSSDWYNAVVDSGLFTLSSSTDSEGRYQVTVKDSVTADQIASWAASAITEYSIDADTSATGTGSSLTVDVGSAGYYYITTTTGSTVTLDSANPTATVIDKNQGPSGLTKSVNDTEAQIGDTLNYEITANVPAYNGENEVESYIFTDVIDASLTYNKDIKVEILNASGSVVATTDSASELYSEAIKVTVETDEATGKTTIVVSYDPTDINSYPADATIKITYSCDLNENAEYANSNTVTSNFDEEGKTVTVYTYGFNLAKYAGSVAEGNELEGAEFKLTDSSNNVVGFIKSTDETTGVITYTVSTDTTDSAYTTTITAGSVTIFGLDADVTYTLTETKAPDGYNLITTSISITVGQDGSYSTTTGINTSEQAVINESGTTLPSTGGIGTTIFYIVGGILVLGAAVLFVTKKRLGSEN